VNLEPGVVAELAKHPLLCALKDANSDPAHMSEIARQCADGISVYSGNDDCVLQSMALGARGVISVAANGTDYTATYEDELLTLELSGGLASASTVNIEITRNMYGRVKIVPICAGGELPDTDILADVLAACTAEDVKVFTDMVVVEAPDVEYYDIELTYYTTKADASAVIENIEGDGGAIDQYIYWQDSSLSNDISPDKLRSFIYSPTNADGVVITGATRADIVKPVYTELNKTTVAKFSGNLTVNHVIKG